MKKIVLLIVLLSLSTIINADTLVGDVKNGQKKAGACVSCHGKDGNSKVGTYPKIAGQHANYITAQLKAFKNGERDNALMKSMVAKLNEQNMADVAAFYATQTMTPGTTAKSALPLGENIFRGGNMKTGLPSCQGCHGPQGKGNAAAGFPALGGQHANYIVAQLKHYQGGTRSHDMMSDIAKKMTDEEIEAVAQYINGLH